jgi:hypothetical protein
VLGLGDVHAEDADDRAELRAACDAVDPEITLRVGDRHPESACGRVGRRASAQPSAGVSEYGRQKRFRSTTTYTPTSTAPGRRTQRRATTTGGKVW